MITCTCTLIDEKVDSCGAGNSVSLPVCTAQMTPSVTNSTSGGPSTPSGGPSTGAIIGISSFVVVTTVLALIILVLVITIVVKQKKWTKQKQNSDDNTYSSLAYNSKLISVMAYS